jgi:hypothetical protein
MEKYGKRICYSEGNIYYVRKEFGTPKEIYTTSEKNLVLRGDGKTNDNFKIIYRIEFYISKFQIFEKKSKMNG